METLIKIAVPRRVGSGRNSDSKNERENTEIPKFIDFNRSPQARTENEREIHCHKHELKIIDLNGFLSKVKARTGNERYTGGGIEIV